MGALGFRGRVSPIRLLWCVSEYVPSLVVVLLPSDEERRCIPLDYLVIADEVGTDAIKGGVADDAQALAGVLVRVDAVALLNGADLAEEALRGRPRRHALQETRKNLALRGG